MNNSQLEVIRDIVNRLPDVLLNIESLDLLDIVKSELTPDVCLWPQTLTSDDEYVLLVELTNAESLSWLLEAWQQDPFLARDREELAGIKTLNEWLTSSLLLPVRHTAEDIKVVLILMYYMVSSWIEHVI